MNIVRAWTTAAKAFDAEALVALAPEDFEMVTMHRGIQRGHDAVRSWAARQTFGVAMHVDVCRYFHRDDTVVAETRIEWRDVETGELAESGDGAAVFVVRDGLVASIAVHPDLVSALSSAGISETDGPELP